MAITDIQKGSANDVAQQKQKPGRINDYSHLAESDDADEILKQVHHYFSDHALPRDAFLFQKTGGHENRPVPVKVIHDFARMKHFQPFSAVVNALQKSDFLNVSEANEITRKVPLDARFTADIAENTWKLDNEELDVSLLARGFPLDMGKAHQTVVESCFEPYNPLYVRCLRDTRGWFKGEAVVVFRSKEDREAALEKKEISSEYQDIPFRVVLAKVPELDRTDSRYNADPNGRRQPNRKNGSKDNQNGKGPRKSGYRDNEARFARAHDGKNWKKTKYDPQDPMGEKKEAAARRKSTSSSEGDPELTIAMDAAKRKKAEIEAAKSTSGEVAAEAPPADAPRKRTADEANLDGGESANKKANVQAAEGAADGQAEPSA